MLVELCTEIKHNHIVIYDNPILSVCFSLSMRGSRRIGEASCYETLFVTPILLLASVFVLLGAVVPLAVYRSVVRFTIVERL